MIKCDIEGSEQSFQDNYSELLFRAEAAVIELHHGYIDQQRFHDGMKALALGKWRNSGGVNVKERRSYCIFASTQPRFQRVSIRIHHITVFLVIQATSKHDPRDRRKNFGRHPKSWLLSIRIISKRQIPSKIS